MQGLFPRTPIIPVATQSATPACEWVMPAPAKRRRDHFSTCKILPPGMPDCIQVDVLRSEEGIERSTSVRYGDHVYLIHYEFRFYVAAG